MVCAYLKWGKVSQVGKRGIGIPSNERKVCKHSGMKYWQRTRQCGWNIKRCEIGVGQGGGDGRGDKKWPDSGYILKLELSTLGYVRESQADSKTLFKDWWKEWTCGKRLVQTQEFGDWRFICFISFVLSGLPTEREQRLKSAVGGRTDGICGLIRSRQWRKKKKRVAS